MALQLLLVEDHQIVRQGLRALLASHPGIEVAAEAATGEEGIRLARMARPDVIVVDLTLPDMTGFDVIREVSMGSGHPRIVVLSMHQDQAYVLEALRSGASGYVFKQATAGDLVRAVREVAAGRRYLSPPLSNRKIEGYGGRSRTGPEEEPYASLTGREREILRLVAIGLSSPEISRILSISCRTVESHRAAVRHKLGVHRHADLVRYAMCRGLIPQESAPAIQSGVRALP